MLIQLVVNYVTLRHTFGSDHISLILQQETPEDGMARLQSKFQNFKAKVNQNVDRQMDRQTNIINPKARIAFQFGQKWG